jgi:hypothetical protein
MIAVSFGSETDTNLLGELTDNVLLFKNTDTSAYKQFFKWVTDSIKTSSVAVESNPNGLDLAKLDNQVISKIDLTKKEIPKQGVDDNFVILSAKCQNTKRPYLMKYRRTIQDSKVSGLELKTKIYKLVGAYQVDNNYFELSDENTNAIKVSSDELLGAPTCPCCGNQFAFAMCSCGKIHCIGDEEVSTCPWCGNQGSYGAGEGGFDVNRTLG